MRRSYFLKYVCILLILSSVTRFIFGFSMLNLYTTTYTFGAVDDKVMTLSFITMFLHIACAISELVGGFIGALHWEEPLLSDRCVRWAAAALSFGLLGNLMQALIEYGVSALAWITGAVVPGLYLLAALHFWYYGKKKPGK